MTKLKLVGNDQEAIDQNNEILKLVEERKAAGDTTSITKTYSMLLKAGITNTVKARFCKIYDLSTADLNKIIRSIDKDEKLGIDLGGTPKNEYEFVSLQLKKWNTTMVFREVFTIDTPYQFSSGTLYASDLAKMESKHQEIIKASDPKTLSFRDMRAALIKQNSILNLNFSDTQIDHALGDWRTIEKNTITGTMIGHIVFDKKTIPKAEIQWDIFSHCITETNIDQTKIVLKHFIWQIKRKIFKLDVENHMMPVLMGAQGIGKSSIIRQLCKPIQEFVANTDFPSIKDERKHSLWQNFVLVIDEMGTSTNNNIEDIKRKITAVDFDGKIMYSNNSTVVVNNATFIGSTNRELSSMIVDSTGMRRFYQIDCIKLDWDITNTIDFNILWQSIDEASESPLVADPQMFKEIMEHIDEKRYIGLVESFLLEREYSESFITIPAITFFKEFQEYERENDPASKYNSTRFGRDVMHYAHRVPRLIITKKRANSGLVYTISKVDARKS